jgi:flagellar biosynthesis/type III secretory pathway protein FliH
MSLSRVLRQPVMGVDRLTVAVPDPVALDPVVRARVEQATALAYEHGFNEGMAAGRREAFTTAETIATMIRDAAQDATAAMAAARQDRAAEVMQVALAISEQVLQREPHDGGMVLAAQLREALEQLDDAPLRVWVSPGDLDVVRAAVDDARGVTIEPDEALQPGEARVRGPWSRAELGYGVAFDIIREALGA